MGLLSCRAFQVQTKPAFFFFSSSTPTHTFSPGPTQQTSTTQEVAQDRRVEEMLSAAPSMASATQG